MVSESRKDRLEAPAGIFMNLGMHHPEVAAGMVSKSEMYPGVKDCKDVSDGGEWVVSTGLLKDANMTFQEIIDCVPLGGTLRLQGNLSIPAPPTVLSQPIVLLSDVDGLKPELACESEGSMFNIRCSCEGLLIELVRFLKVNVWDGKDLKW